MTDFIGKELKLIGRINESLVKLEHSMEKLETGGGFRQFVEQEKSIRAIKTIVACELKLAEMEAERERRESACVYSRTIAERNSAAGLCDELADMERSIWCLMLRTNRLLRFSERERPLKRLRRYLHKLEDLKSGLPDSINRIRLSWLRSG